MKFKIGDIVISDKHAGHQQSRFQNIIGTIKRIEMYGNTYYIIIPSEGEFQGEELSYEQKELSLVPPDVTF